MKTYDFPPDNAREVLERAKENWPPERYTKGVLGRNAKGRSLQDGDYGPNSIEKRLKRGEAVTCCVGGAAIEAIDGAFSIKSRRRCDGRIVSYTYEGDHEGVLGYLSAAAHELYPDVKKGDVINFAAVNDKLGYEAAVRVLDRAIELAQEDFPA